MHEFKRRFPPPPSDWSRPLLADIADRVTSRNVERNPNVLTISAELGLISQSEFFRRRVASESVAGYFLLERGDFAYNKSYSRGYPLGAIRRLDRYEKGCVSPLYICFRPRADAVDSDFLLHYLDGGAIDAGLADVAKEGVRNHGLLNVGVTDFFSLEVPLPPVAEQRVTAQVLDTLDTTIRQTEAIIEKLKQVKQGLLHDLLTRGIDANGELRPPHSQAPHLYKDSPLGWIPDSWNVLNLEEMVAAPICYGIVQVLGFVHDGVPVLAIKDLLGDYLSGVHRTARSIDEAYSRSRVKPGDVLVSIKGTIGRVGVVPDHYAGNISRDIARLRPGPMIRSNFFGQLLRSQIGQRTLALAQVGTTRAELSIAPLRKLRFAIPDVREQTLIEVALSAQDRRLISEEVALSKLRSAKSGLMDDLLTGRVRVTPLLRQVQQEVS